MFRLASALLVSFVLCLGLAVPTAADGDSITGPTLGYVFDRENRALLPILGIPGAAHIGAAMALPFQPVALEVAPGHKLALAVDSEGVLHGIDLSRAQPTHQVMPVQIVGPTLMAFSPQGRAAAVYDRGSERIFVLKGETALTTVATPIELGDLEGVLTRLAISDDAEVLAGALADRTQPLRARSTGGVSLFSMSSSGAAVQIGRLGGVSSINFVPESHEILVVDDSRQEVLVAKGLDSHPSISVLATARDGLEGPRIVTVDGDLGQAIVTLEGTEGLALVPLAGGPPQFVECACKPQELSRLRGKSLYRITSNPRRPIFLLDVSIISPDGLTSIPTVIFVPASQNL